MDETIIFKPIGYVESPIKDKTDVGWGVVQSKVKIHEQFKSGLKGLDAIDGTPVIDIKPYYPRYDTVEKAIVPNWVHEIMKDYF